MREHSQQRVRHNRMSNNSSSTSRRRKHHRNNYRRLYTFILMAVVIICSSVILFGKSVSSASNEPYKQICYTSIEIQPGDSLWSIASEHYTDDWEDVEAYMEEIKEFNGLTNNVIHAGNYLSIPYITEVEFK